MKELIAIQAELKCSKSKRNTFANFNYRSAEDILEAVKPLLSKYGCLLTLSDDLVMLGERVFIKVTAEFTAPDGTKTSVTACAEHAKDKKGMDVAQISGSASSYARKYALAGLFLLDDEKDADALPPPDSAVPTKPPPPGGLSRPAWNPPPPPINQIPPIPPKR